MRIIKIYLVIILSILLFGNTIARQKINIWDPPVQKGISSLKVGDVVPDFKIEKIFNGKKKSAKVSDFSDRLLIFDFGNTGCKGCVEALPRMDSLEKRFGTQLRIFWVTPEAEATLQRFWKRNKYTQNNSLQTIVEDSTARAYFNHKSWPHEAWVYKGKVIALTGPDYVDAANISKVLNGEKTDWPVKNDFYVFDPDKPLFTPDPNQMDTGGMVLKYAAISDYKEGVPEYYDRAEGIIRNPNKKMVRAYFINKGIYNLYQICFNRIYKPDALVKPGLIISPNEMVWEVKDQSAYRFERGLGYEEEWKRHHAVCFESLNTDTGQTDQQVYQSVIADLNVLLGLKVRWEKRQEKVLVLVRTSSTDKLRTKHTLSPGSSIEKVEEHIKNGEHKKESLYQFRDYPLANLVYKMNQYAENPYVFNETGYQERVDMDLDIKSWTDISGLRKALRHYDLDLKEEERLVDKFVFTEVDGGLVVKK